MFLMVHMQDRKRMIVEADYDDFADVHDDLVEEIWLSFEMLTFAETGSDGVTGGPLEIIGSSTMSVQTSHLTKVLQYDIPIVDRRQGRTKTGEVIQ